MLEMQEEKRFEKSDPQSQEINTGWQKYTFETLNQLNIKCRQETTPKKIMLLQALPKLKPSVSTQPLKKMDPHTSWN